MLLLVLREEGREGGRKPDWRCTEPEGQSTTAAATTVMARARTLEGRRRGRAGEEVEATHLLHHHHSNAFMSPALLFSFLSSMKAEV